MREIGGGTVKEEALAENGGSSVSYSVPQLTRREGGNEEGK